MLFIPYAFYLYNYFPDVKSYETIFGTFESHYYESVRYSIWAILSKLIPLILLIVWFTTCKHWWWYSIAIPISVYVFQLLGVINDDVQFNDEFEFIYSLPVTLLVLTILFFVRSKISLYLKAVDLKKKAEELTDRPMRKEFD